jgi:hypothetical protein
VVGELEWQGSGPSIQFGAKDDTYDLTKLSAGIPTYNEEVEDKKKINELRDLVSAAQRMVFLGFHFHKQNIELISPVPNAPKLRGSIEMFATHVDRSQADKGLIFDQRLPRVRLAAPSVQYETSSSARSCLRSSGYC